MTTKEISKAYTNLVDEMIGSIYNFMDNNKLPFIDLEVFSGDIYFRRLQAYYGTDNEIDYISIIFQDSGQENDYEYDIREFDRFLIPVIWNNVEIY